MEKFDVIEPTQIVENEENSVDDYLEFNADDLLAESEKENSSTIEESQDKSYSVENTISDYEDAVEGLIEMPNQVQAEGFALLAKNGNPSVFLMDAAEKKLFVKQLAKYFKNQGYSVDDILSFGFIPMLIVFFVVRAFKAIRIRNQHKRVKSKLEKVEIQSQEGVKFSAIGKKLERRQFQFYKGPFPQKIAYQVGLNGEPTNKKQAVQTNYELNEDIVKAVTQAYEEGIDTQNKATFNGRVIEILTNDYDYKL